MALNGLFCADVPCADVPLRNYSLTHPYLKIQLRQK